MQKKHKYFLIHFENGIFSVKTNEADRSTILVGAPIFLSDKTAWDWLIETNEPIGMTI